MYIKICAYSSRSGHTMKICRYIKIFVYIKIRALRTYIRESVTAGPIIMCSNGNRKMAANMANSSLPNEEDISSLVRSVYRAMTEEVPRVRSRVSGGNSSNVEEELSRNFRIPRFCVQQPPLYNPRVNYGSNGIPRVGVQQPPLYNPRVNYGSNGNSGKKGKLRSSSWKGKSAKESPHSISCKELVLLPAPTVDEVPRCGKKRKLQEMGLIVDGFPLDKNWGESQLKLKVGGALVDVLQDEEGGVIPFEFVKSIGKSICPLNLFSDKELTGATLAGLCRQGPIYVRATKQLRFWPMEDASDDDEDNEEFKRRAEQVPEKSARGRIQVGNSSSQSNCIPNNLPRGSTLEEAINLPGPSGAQDVNNQFKEADCLPLKDCSGIEPSCSNFLEIDALHDSDIHEVEDITNNDQATACVSRLREIFPDMSSEYLKKKLEENGDDLDLAVSDILKAWEYTSSVTLESLLERLGRKVKGDHDVVKIKVDPDDILGDALAIYKDPEFDPALPIRVTYRGQPAVDLGGVKRQFFTDVLGEMASSTHLAFLEGPDLRRLPAYNSGVISSGLMKLFGSAVAHGIVHAKVGIPFLSQAFYWYIATADVNKAIPYASPDDICDQDIRHYVDAVLSLTDKDDLLGLNEDDKFIEILSASGVTSHLSVQNRMNIVQAIMLHYVLNTRKVCMDQFREGLRTLDVLQSIEKHPSVWEPLFVHRDSSVTTEEFKSVLKPPISMNERQQVIWEYLLRFVDSCSLHDLKKLTKFLTGSENLSSSGAKVKGITVSFDGEAGVFSSTCTLKCELPPHFPDYESFTEVMLAVINDMHRSSFTVV